MNDQRDSAAVKRAFQSLIVLLPEMPQYEKTMENFIQRLHTSIAKPPFNSHVYEEFKKTHPEINETPYPPPQAARLYDAVKVGLHSFFKRNYLNLL